MWSSLCGGIWESDLMFCQNCGTQQNENARFCENCGAGINGAAPCGGYAPAQPSYDPSLIGFSQRIHDPVFEELRKESFRRSINHGLFFLPIVVLLFQIAPFFSDDFTRPIALTVGCIVGGFGLVGSLLGGARQAMAKDWDGEVIDKKITEHQTYGRNDNIEMYYFHTIYFRLAGGGRKKMRKRLSTGELDHWDMMVYLNIGDNARYHGKLDYFEKYDKSRDTQVPCANCRQFIDIRLDNCPVCRVPVIKP